MTTDAATSEANDPSRTRSSSRSWVVGHAIVSTNVAVLLFAIWLVDVPHRSFWPAWVVVSLGGLVVAHAGAAAALRGGRRARVGTARVQFEIAASILGAIAAMLWGFWLVDGPSWAQVPWPAWPTIALAFVLALSAVPAQVQAADGAARRRIEQLTRTRVNVVEAQELELRRIERDLHDGAQARLVLLGMQLGQLERRIDDDELRQLVAEARATATSAQGELRDLARGIYPPVLADRGLVAAVESLAAHAGGTVRVHSQVDGRLPAAVEGACYFVVAESIANAVKHGDAARVDVRIARGPFDVAVVVDDDGRGGADPAGTGIAGMRRRVEALDGTLVLTSPAGGPTTIRAEVPCAS